VFGISQGHILEQRPVVLRNVQILLSHSRHEIEYCLKEFAFVFLFARIISSSSYPFFLQIDLTYEDDKRPRHSSGRKSPVQTRVWS
jgi:hypothetical protein